MQIIDYYKSLTPDNESNNIKNREHRIAESNSSLSQHYSSIVNNLIEDRRRSIITRWRLSNHKLLIETGRYSTSPMPRKCMECNALEDD